MVLKKEIQLIKSKIIEMGLELCLTTINRSSLSDVWWEFDSKLWCIATESCLPKLFVVRFGDIEQKTLGSCSESKVCALHFTFKLLNLQTQVIQTPVSICDVHSTQ